MLLGIDHDLIESLARSVSALHIQLYAANITLVKDVCRLDLHSV